MESPPVSDFDANVIFKLKAFYGLKHASTSWNKNISEFSVNYGFEKTASDSCVYSRDFQRMKEFYSYI